MFQSGNHSTSRVVMTAITLAFVAASPSLAQHEGHTMPGTSKEAKMAPHSQHTMMQMSQQDVQELRTLQGDARERTYLTKMLDHHQSGIDMAKLALAKSQNSAIRQEAQQIIDDQAKEIAQMRQHLAEQHKVNRTAKPDPRMQPTMQNLQGLSGAAFDQAFAHQMSMHHQGAIDMSSVVTKNGIPHREVRTLAQKIIQGNKKSQKDLAKALGAKPHRSAAS